MTAHVRQNIYAAWLDGDLTAMEALRSLCSDFEELDATYKDFEGLRDQTRDQISNVLVKIGDRVDVKGFGVLTLMQPSIVEGFDKKLLTELIIALTLEGNTDVAQRLAACRTKSARAGGLRIEREKK
jgi:hypothetical protein